MTVYAATIQPNAEGWHKYDQPRIMIPSVETAVINRWRSGYWIMSVKWQRPRQIRGRVGDRVRIAQVVRGSLHGMRATRAFPADVHRVHGAYHEVPATKCQVPPLEDD